MEKTAATPIPAEKNPLFGERIKEFVEFVDWLQSQTTTRDGRDYPLIPPGAFALWRGKFQAIEARAAGQRVENYVDTLIGEGLMDFPIEVLDTCQIASWLCQVGIMARFIDRLSKNPDHRDLVGWLKIRFRLLAHHPAFIFADARLHRLHCAVAELLGVSSDTRFAGRAATVAWMPPIPEGTTTALDGRTVDLADGPDETNPLAPTPPAPPLKTFWGSPRQVKRAKEAIAVMPVVTDREAFRATMAAKGWLKEGVTP